MIALRARSAGLVLALGIASALTLASAEDLVPNQALGVRLARGFRISLFADSDLANDCFAITLDSLGRVVVTSRSYIRTLQDTDGDGKADRSS